MTFHRYPPPTSNRGDPTVHGVQRTRLVPPTLPTRWLPRPRLLDALDPVDGDQIVLLGAPAGAGKSTLVADWLSARGRTAAWLTLSPRDTALPILASHLIAALRHVAPGIAARTQTLMAGASPVDLAAVRRSFFDDIHDLPAGVHVVLDGLHHLPPGPAYDFISNLLRFPPAHTRWLLLSRVPLPAPGHLMKSRGILREISFQELLFTPEETSRFLSNGPTSPAMTAATERIHAETEGWPALVCAIARRLPAGATTSDVEALLGENGKREIGAFLASEVFAAMPPHTLATALAAAVCEEFDLEMARTLTASLDPQVDPAAAMAAIARDGAIAAAPPHNPGRLRWRPIARVIARDLLDRRFGPTMVRRQHEIAARVVAAGGGTLDAIRHAILADDEVFAASVVVDVGFSRLAGERWSDIAAMLDVLPPAVVDRQAGLLTLRAWVAWSRGAKGAMAVDIARARALLDATPTSGAEHLRTHGYLAALESVRAADEHQLAAAVAATTSTLATLPLGENVGRGVALQAVITGAALAGQPAIAERTLAKHDLHTEMFSTGLGARTQVALANLAYLTRFDLDTMRTHLVEGAYQAKRFDLPSTYLQAHAWLAAVALLRLELTEAEGHLESCREELQDVTQTTWREVQCSTALLHALRGDHATAADVINDTIDQSTCALGSDRAAALRAFKARLALLRGDNDRALHWALSAPAGPDQDPLTLTGAAEITAVRALATSRDPAHLARALDRATLAVESAIARRHRPLLAGAHAARASVRVAIGDVDGAIDDLAAPLTDLAGNRAPLHLLELGPSIAVALRAISPSNERYVLARTLAGQILLDPRDRVAWAAGPLVRQLTLSPREISVLMLVARPLGNKEIAEALHISPATVKIHVANILAKLGVPNRAEAARRAHALGLASVTEM